MRSNRLSERKRATYDDFTRTGLKARSAAGPSPVRPDRRGDVQRSCREPTLLGVHHKVQRPRDRRPSAGRAMDLGSCRWLQGEPGSLPTPDMPRPIGIDAATQLSPRTGIKARQGRRSIARPAPPDGRCGAFEQGTHAFRGCSIKCQDPAMCAHPPDGRGTSCRAISRRAVRAQCSYLTGSSGREIGWTSAFRTLKEQTTMATLLHPTEIDRMFAVGTARVFLEALSRWAFENEVCFPPEIREELKRFANENGRPFEEIRSCTLTDCTLSGRPSARQWVEAGSS